MTPSELQRMIFDFRAARAVLCAVELGVFDALGADARSAHELAELRGLDLRGTRTLLQALSAIGVLEAETDRYRIHAELLPWLVPGGPHYVGNLMLHDLWHWSSWARLDHAVRTGRALETREGDPHLGNPEILKRFFPNYVAAMDQCAADAPVRLAKHLAPLCPRSVMDLGGGTGALLCELLECVPDARGTLVELPFSLAPARERIKERGLESRIEILARNFESGELPEGHDLIVLSRTLMGLPPERARTLVRRAARGLSPAGTLAIHDYAAESRVGALLSLDMLLNTGGAVHPSARQRSWLEEAGLVELRCERVLPYTRLWTGRKPDAAEEAAEGLRH